MFIETRKARKCLKPRVAVFRKDEEKWKIDQYVIPCQVQFHSTRRDWTNAGEGREGTG